MLPETDLARFTQMHELNYDLALREIQSGRKRGHWMWYIFPQLRGIGHSSTSHYYGIEDLAEARAFLENPVLGAHLKEISRALLPLETGRPEDVFDYPDDMKLHACMTLFCHAAEGTADQAIFEDVLKKYFHGKPHRLTEQRLHI